jgi:hypothetical protein
MFILTCNFLAPASRRSNHYIFPHPKKFDCSFQELNTIIFFFLLANFCTGFPVKGHSCPCVTVPLRKLTFLKFSHMPFFWLRVPRIWLCSYSHSCWNDPLTTQIQLYIFLLANFCTGFPVKGHSCPCVTVPLRKLTFLKFSHMPFFFAQGSPYMAM